MRAGVAITSLLLASIPSALAGNVTQLTGTWTSKSDTVVTGPDIYDPVGERLLEPRLPGTSFSFTDDGFFEEAVYIVIPNPTKPECPQAQIIWQHGKYELHKNGSLLLWPISSDGRRLWSDPCKSKKSVYTRYYQEELYKGWDIEVDQYRGQFRLRLYKFDGAPMNPLYLTYRPPQMLPTTTLKPTPTATETSESTATAASKMKRWIQDATTAPTTGGMSKLDRWWYLAVGMTVLGGIGYFCV